MKMSLECVGFARDSAMVEDQVRFLVRTLTRRWSQTVRRLPAKQLSVGSTPTGVSYKQGSDVVWTSGAPFILMDLNRCVPDMDSEDDDVVTVSSEVEHQTMNLESRVRPPYHNRRLERVGSTGRESVHHEARGRRASVGSAASWFAK